MTDSVLLLPYTLQTRSGIVVNLGRPASRPTRLESGATHRYLLMNTVETQAVTLPLITWFQDFLQTDWSSAHHTAIPATVIKCLRSGRRPDERYIEAAHNADKKRFVDNVDACRNDFMDGDRLAALIKSRTRLDLEQAAGAVVSSFVNAGRQDDAETLVRELTGVIAASAMSVTDLDSLVRHNHLSQIAANSFSKFAGKVRYWCRRAEGTRGRRHLGKTQAIDGDTGDLLPTLSDYSSLVPLLLRIRSSRPSTRDRCLYIPMWMFAEAGIDPPLAHTTFLHQYPAGIDREGILLDSIKGYHWPQNKPTDEAGQESIVLSKHGFRVVQRGIFHLFPFWDASFGLRRKIRTLKDKVLYGTGQLDQWLTETDDVGQMACWFFGFQRRLQPKVVSDGQWTRLLAKGESHMLFQNNLDLKSTFEVSLAHIAGLRLDSLAADDGTLELIDETCLLMKRYVDVHGGGQKHKLVSSKTRRDSSERGPVEEYNMLCDILHELKVRAKRKCLRDVPGPVYKFLARDIMQWNDSWEEDAFVGDKVHGWEHWIRDRRLDRLS